MSVYRAASCTGKCFSCIWCWFDERVHDSTAPTQTVVAVGRRQGSVRWDQFIVAVHLCSSTDVTFTTLAIAVCKDAVGCEEDIVWRYPMACNVVRLQWTVYLTFLVSTPTAHSPLDHLRHHFVERYLMKTKCGQCTSHKKYNRVIKCRWLMNPLSCWWSFTVDGSNGCRCKTYRFIVHHGPNRDQWSMQTTCTHFVHLLVRECCRASCHGAIRVIYAESLTQNRLEMQIQQK